MRNYIFPFFFFSRLTLKSILVNEGFSGLFRGFQPTLYREVPGCFFYFLANEATKSSICHVSGRSRDQLGPASILFSGGMAGIGFWFFIYPVDVVKSKMQVVKESAQGTRQGGAELAKEIWNRDGVKGFYRGLVPCLLRAFPAAASTFLVYEYSKDFMTTKMTR